MVKKCLRQVFIPNGETRIPVDGVGDCTICTTDSDNEKCKLYYPIELIIDETVSGTVTGL